MNMPLVLLNRRRRGGSFSPYSLFSGTAIGTWFDPSDLTTMYQDAAGTTPVTTPGQPVGLRLDKSKGLALGAELVANGDFSGGTTGWTAGSAAGNLATIAVSSGEFVVTNTTASQFGRAFQAITCVVGRSYKVEALARVISASTGRAGLYLVNASNVFIGPATAEVSATTLTPVTMTFFATATTHYIAAGVAGVGANAGATFGFDNISVRELPGNHATQSVLASRPTYGIEPAGGRRNLLVYSEQFDDAVWLKTGVTVASNAAAAPDGTSSADKIAEQATSAGHFVYNVAGVAAAPGQCTGSIYLKSAERGFGYVQIATNGGGKRYTVVVDLSTGAVTSTGSSGTPTGTANSVVSAGNGWWRVSVSSDQATSLAYLLTGPVSTGVPTFDASAIPTYTGVLGSGILIWGAQFETGSTTTAYQRVTTAYDVTESGVATCHYVQYDGSDDSMSTSAIDFTGTDKMSVFAGVRKLSDAAAGMLLELSANIALNAGSFYMAAPETIGAGGDFSFKTRGSVNPGAFASSGTMLAPTTRVLTGVGDIPADLAGLRVNGGAQVNYSADQGTGNYGNYPLFIGRRNNATLPFNGRDYGLIIVGKAASAGEITDTETWLAAKTSGVTL